MGEVDLGVDLGRGEGAVAKELLDCAQVHSGFQKMGSECVSQSVWVEMVEIRSAADRVVELAADGPITETASTLVDEERVVLVTDISAPTGALGKIGLDGFRSWPAEWHEALFAALAAYPDDPLSELDIAEVESNQFSDPKSRGVQ